MNNLLDTFLLAQSVFAFLASILILLLVVLVIYLINTVKILRTKAEKMADKTIAATEETKNVALKVGKTIVDYLVIKIIDGFSKEGRRRR